MGAGNQGHGGPRAQPASLKRSSEQMTVWGNTRPWCVDGHFPVEVFMADRNREDMETRAGWKKAVNKNNKASQICILTNATVVRKRKRHREEGNLDHGVAGGDVGNPVSLTSTEGSPGGFQQQSCECKVEGGRGGKPPECVSLRKRKEAHCSGGDKNGLFTVNEIIKSRPDKWPITLQRLAGT